MEHNQNFLNNELQVDHVAQGQLKETAMWAKFLGITGFIGAVILLLVAIFSGTIFSQAASQPAAGPNIFATIGPAVFAAIYIVAALITFGLSYLLFKFGQKIQQALRTTDQVTLNAGFTNLKLFFRTYGIIVIVYFGFVLLAMIFGLVSFFVAR